MKKRLWLSVCAFIISLGIVPFNAPPARAAQNLIANASVETGNVNDNLPVNWQKDRWGTLTAQFVYKKNEGYQSARSIRVNVSGYQSGDAKWSFTPVAVDPNTDYTFSNYYKSNVQTALVAVSLDTDGVPTYLDISTSVPASSTSWKQVTGKIKTLATTKKLIVYHLIAKNGWLQTDAASLTKDEPTPPTDPSNLVPNTSLEQSGGAPLAPSAWLSNSWGSNSAQFEYLNEGRTGTHSVKTTITGYQSGDAKWFFEPVDVQPDTEYVFSDYYKSSVPTKIVAVSYDSGGTPTYFDIATNLPASSSAWKQASASLKTLAGTKKLSIYHIIEQNGWLQLDDVSLAKSTTTPVASVPNPSLEESTGSPAAPVSWQGESWGTNTPKFEYLNEGHTGSRSVKVTLSNYQDGDAKWTFTPQILETGKDYRFKAWYKSDVIPQVVARFIKGDGSEEYFGLPQPLASSTTNWQQYSDTFSVPEGTQAVTVFMFLNKNGWLQTDDYTIEPYQPVGFSRPLVTLTFDDGFEENVTTVLPRLNNLGIKSTQCYATQFIEGVPNQPQNVQAFSGSGHEICSHTVTHPALSQLPADQQTYELTHSQSYLRSITNQGVTTFSSPFGDYDASVLNQIKNLYRAHRTTDEGYNTKDNFDPYRIRVQNMTPTTTLDQFQEWLNKAKTDKTWLVLVYHRVTTGTPDSFDTKENDFVQQLNTLAESGITIKTFNDALDELAPQL